LNIHFPKNIRPDKIQIKSENIKFVLKPPRLFQIMESQQSVELTSESPSFPAPQRAPYKFLTRNLTITVTENIWGPFQKVEIKGLYVKKLIWPRAYEYNKYSSNPFHQELFPLLKNKKIWKTLKHVEMPYLCHGDLDDFLKAFKILKASKNITSFSINSQGLDTHLPQVAFYLRSLPAQVQKIKLRIKNKDLSADDEIFYKVAKSIRFLPKLQCFDRCYDLPGKNQSYLPKELQIYKRVMSRLPNLKKFVQNVSPFEQHEFQKLMNAGGVSPGITDLKLHLSLFDFPFYLLRDPQEYQDSHDHDESFENSQDQMEEGMKPYYRFDLFPNLKELRISHESKDREFLHPLVFCGIDGFGALKNLERLKICVDARLQDPVDFFKALQKLPLLKKFSLTVEFRKEEEWILLQEFLRNQKNLESICIDIKGSSDFEDDKGIEALIESLKNKPFLRSIQLKSNAWSLEAISKGFVHLRDMINQLHTLKIQARDGRIQGEDLEAESEKRVKGLCILLENHRDSLKMLEVNISKIVEDGPVDHIGKAISKLSQLRELSLSLGPCDSDQRRSDESPYFTLYSSLPRLENLEIFKLIFTAREIDVYDLRPGKWKDSWFWDLMDTLPRFKKLRRVSVESKGDDLTKSRQYEFRDTVHWLNNIKSIETRLSFFDEYNEGDVLKPAVKKINERQSMRCDLMF